jgi:hypothetical protein
MYKHLIEEMVALDEVRPSLEKDVDRCQNHQSVRNRDANYSDSGGFCKISMPVPDATQIPRYVGVQSFDPTLRDIAHRPGITINRMSTLWNIKIIGCQQATERSEFASVTRSRWLVGAETNEMARSVTAPPRCHRSEIACSATLSSFSADVVWD